MTSALGQLEASRSSRFGELLRGWRTRRGMTQLSLAGAAGTPTRHVSFLETGRARPGADMVLRLASALEVPLRGRNELLEAAGLAAVYRHRPLSDAALAPYRRAIDHALAAFDPYPAIVVDGALVIVDANRAARRLFALSAAQPRATLVELLFGSRGIRDQLVNYAEVGWAWHDRLVRESSGDAVAEALIARIAQYLHGIPRPDEDDALVICPTFKFGEQLVRTIGMTVRFGPSREVTLQELSIEVLYPRDQTAEAALRSDG